MFIDHQYVRMAYHMDEVKPMIDAVSDEDKQRFTSRTFCPPPSTKLSSPFVTAAYNGNLSVLQYLLETFPFIEVDASCKYISGEYIWPPKTALVSICETFADHSDVSLEALQCLVGKGANVKQKARDGKSLLQMLSKLSVDTCLKAIKCLLEAGADVNEIDEHGNTLLFTQYAQVALEFGANIHHRNEEGFTALHVACKEGKQDLVEALLDGGLPPMVATSAKSALPDYMACPLYFAAATGDENVCKAFIKKVNCPVECIADVNLIVGVGKFRNTLKYSSSYQFFAEAMKLIEKHKIELIYPPLRIEYSFVDEVRTKKELDEVWDAEDYLNEELVVQSSLILERCFGQHSLVVGQAQFTFGLELIKRYYYYSIGDLMMELGINNIINYDKDYRMMPEKKVIFNIWSSTQNMMDKKHIPNYRAYAKYGAYSVACAKAQSAEKELAVYFMEEAMKSFMWWHVTGKYRDEFHTELKDLVTKFLHYPKGTTVLHKAIFIVDRALFGEIKGPQATAFLEAVLDAGAYEVMNCVDERGIRPIQAVHISYTVLTPFLVAHGAHHDTVNQYGQTAPFTDHRVFGISSLYCIVANAIVKHRLPYKKVGLPSHVVYHISLHDKCTTKCIHGY